MDQVLAQEGARPTRRLPARQLLLISGYWFGISAVWGAYEQFGQKQLELGVGSSGVGLVMAVFEFLGGLVAILVVPTIGTISDYTVSRWGRRKGYILSGALMDFVFLGGLAFIALPEPEGWTGNGLAPAGWLVAYLLLLLGLQFSSNLAQGPYQGYVPDLVPEPQVGIASGAMGLMRLTGLLVGTGVVLAGAAFGQWGLPLLVVATIELTLAVATFKFVQEGPAGRSREGRPWIAIAREAWGTDLLRERSFLRMSGVRLFFLIGTGIFVNLSLFYVERSLGQTDPGMRSAWQFTAVVVLACGTLLAPLPAARISDRVGRKPVIWAAIALAATGLAIIVVAPAPIAALPGAFLLGLGSGAYLSVDWALMTDVIPLVSSGRYMGLANIANSISGPLGLIVGGVLMDRVFDLGLVGESPRVAISVGIVALGIAALLLRGVQPRRDPRDAVATEPGPTLAPLA